MTRLTINGHALEVSQNTTVLEAAQRLDIHIPTLCHCNEIGPLTACMLCVVKDTASGKTIPACAAKVREGMVIITENEQIHALRQGTLQLLLAEHAGDCEGPCTRACPAGLDIPRMLRCIEQDDLHEALAIARRDLIFPAILGRVCAAPCERICRRGQYDGPLEIRSAHGGIAEQCSEVIPPPPPFTSGHSVAVIGAGLAALAAACTCVRQGHACHLYAPETKLCPALRGQVPDAILDDEFARLVPGGVVLHLGETTPITALAEVLLAAHDAVIVAGAPETKAQTQTVGLYGAREEKMPVRAVAAGKRAAHQVNAALEGLSHTGKRRFNSKLGPLAEEELEVYAVERDHWDGTKTPSCDAARCLHCDCLKPDACLLRRYADRYGAQVSSNRMLPRPKVAPVERFGNILYEPGKCIRCGICVAITHKHDVRPGMAFTGRGIKSRVRGALGALLPEALGAVGEACVRACPTAALALQDQA